MELYNKYRPTVFEEMVGDYTHIKQLESNALLFHGPSGTGKTVSAFALAKHRGATEADIQYINASDKNGVDDVREILERTVYAPIGAMHFIIFDECHKLSDSAMNCLLIPVEEAPPRICYCFCTSQVAKVDKALRSRCTPVAFTSIDPDEVFKVLRKVSTEEGTMVQSTVLSSISESCNGNMRQALSELATVIPMEPEQRVKYVATLGVDGLPEFIEIARAFWNGSGYVKIFPMVKALKDLNNWEGLRLTIWSYGISMSAKGIDIPMVKVLECFVDNWQYDGYNRCCTALARACLTK